MKVGNIVRVKEPFNYLFPDEYVILEVKDDADKTCVICEDRDFHPKYLELV